VTNKALTENYRRYRAGEITFEEREAAANEIHEAARRKKVKGTEGTYTAAEVALDSRDGRYSGPFTVIADATQEDAVRRALMFRGAAGWVKEEFLAAFGGRMLADIYLLRLRKKGIVDDGFALLEVPEESSLPSRVLGRSPGRCFCGDAKDLSPNYNNILYSKGSSYANAYDTTTRVEWFIGRIHTPEEYESHLREEAERERREIAQRVEDYYAEPLQGGAQWASISDTDEVHSTVELIDTMRGDYEAEWMDQEGQMHCLDHNAKRLAAIASGTLIAPFAEQQEESLRLGTRLVSEQEAAQALMEHAAFMPRVRVQRSRRHSYF
jgi:hypothetical protein